MEPLCDFPDCSAVSEWNVMRTVGQTIAWYDACSKHKGLLAERGLDE